jgi:hypothetical protein
MLTPHNIAQDVMKRECPNCRERTISKIKLVFQIRSKCISCHKRVGLGWILASVFGVFDLLVLGAIGLVSGVETGAVIWVVGLTGVLLVLTYVSVNHLPLEAR